MEVTGHSMAAPKGEDIVCSAVSALVQALLFGLERHCGVEVACSAWESGRLAATWPRLGDGRVLFLSIVDALREIEKRNGEYIEIFGADDIMASLRNEVKTDGA